LTPATGSPIVPDSLSGFLPGIIAHTDSPAILTERFDVNVTVENLAPCKKLLRIEVEPAKVDEAFASVTKQFQREANLPGFRPGKAPKEMVVRKYQKDIDDEVKRQLISDSYKKTGGGAETGCSGLPGYRGDPVWARTAPAIRRDGGDIARV